MTEQHPITPPPPHLLRKFSAQAQDEAKKRNGAGYLKTFATLCIEWAMNRQSTPNDRQIRSSEIEPSPEVVQQLWGQCPAESENLLNKFATLMARWGADQELEACIKYFHEYDASWGEHSDLVTGLRATRRPKLPTLKEQALKAIGVPAKIGEARVIEHREHELIRRALEQLPD
ncbi:MAG: hypothetical protein VKI63_04410 [Cyanobium sp.]|nr:hypothetical protein [Cyanobium sp.]